MKKLTDYWLPDHLCYYPKRAGYYTESGFGDRGYPDTTAYGWEEFVWQQEPFGFHLRLWRKKNRDRAWEMATLVRVLSDLSGVSAVALLETRHDTHPAPDATL